MHGPIFFENTSLCFPNKTCFEDFSAQIRPADRIAVIGKNGSGKTSLLNLIRKVLEPSAGKVIVPDSVRIGYVQQTISNSSPCSGGQRFNRHLTRALGLDPDVLLLDEPTNHLDGANRKSLLRMLDAYRSTLVIVSHDVELLRHCVDTFWHVENGRVYCFSGSYDDYVHEISLKRQCLEKEIADLKRQKKSMHEKLMQEQQRASKSAAKGRKNVGNRKWLKVLGNLKAAKAQNSCGKKQKSMDTRKQNLSDRLSHLKAPKNILPEFSIIPSSVCPSCVLSISGANIGYVGQTPVLRNISLSLGAEERIGICGNNASGKSTLLKAMLGAGGIVATGSWNLPDTMHIGYLDQHYSNLDLESPVIAHLQGARPDWSQDQVRRHLNSFLFCTNEEVGNAAGMLSGGEKARLSLAIIAAKTPRLLILDEITNNLDLETREHAVEVLKHYPGAMVLVSHDEDFLRRVCVDHRYVVENGCLRPG